MWLKEENHQKSKKGIKKGGSFFKYWIQAKKNYKIRMKNYIKRPKEANNTKWKISCLVVAILIIGSVLMVPVNVQETYEATESYTEKEPYTATETYYVKEPYTVYVPLSYMVLDHSYWNFLHREFYTR